jgi:hypothetical protein
VTVALDKAGDGEPLLGHTDPTLTMRVYQQVLDMVGAAVLDARRQITAPPSCAGYKACRDRAAESLGLHRLTTVARSPPGAVRWSP